MRTQAENIKSEASTNPEYNKLMWLLDNICDPSDEESVTKLLSAANLTKEEDFNGSNLEEKEFKDVIEVIQQTAIWRITNQGDTFLPADHPQFYVAENVGTDGRELEEEYNFEEIEGSPVQTLFNYLISNAEANENYNYSQSSTSTQLISESAKITQEGQFFYIGPYSISGDVNAINEITIKANDEPSSDAKLVDNEKTNELTIPESGVTEEIKQLLENEFYIKVPTSARGENHKNRNIYKL